MFVDPMTLPIPEACDLVCPRCRYPLRGLPSHVCPECGLTLDIPALTRSWTRWRLPRITGHESPLPDIGLVCARCQTPLAGSAGGRCGACGEPFDIESHRPNKAWAPLDPSSRFGLAAPVVEMLLASEQIPYVAGENKTALEHYMGTPAGTGRLLIARDFYFEALALLAATRREMDTQRGAPWRCAKCGEESPGDFEVCWSCGAERATGNNVTK